MNQSHQHRPLPDAGRLQPGTAASVDHIRETPFYIPATAGATRLRRMLKHDDCFAVFDSHGDIGAAPGGPDGLYYRDTRHLGHLEFLINGTQPLLLGSSVRDDNTVFTVDLTNPDLYLDLELSLSKDTLHVHRTIFICNACCFQRWSVENFGQHSVDCTLTLTFGSDFADVFEVRGMRRTRRGASGVTADSKVTVLQYEGLDGVRRETVLTFNPVPMRLSKGFASPSIWIKPAGRSAAQHDQVGHRSVDYFIEDFV